MHHQMRIWLILGSRKISLQSFWRIMKAIDPVQETVKGINKLLCKQEEGNELEQGQGKGGIMIEAVNKLEASCEERNGEK